MTPQRIQRKRSRGWHMPEGAVYVGRPTKWGNPYRLGTSYPEAGGVVSSRAQAVELYERYATPTATVLDEIRGLDLACWCPLGQPCHADVLLRLANDAPGTQSDSDVA